MAESLITQPLAPLPIYATFFAHLVETAYNPLLLPLALLFVTLRRILAIKLNNKRIFTDTFVYIACHKLSSIREQVFPPCNFTLPRIWLLILNSLRNHKIWYIYSNLLLFFSILLFSTVNQVNSTLALLLFLSTPYLWHNIFGSYALSSRPIGFCFTLIAISYQIIFLQWCALTTSPSPYILLMAFGWLILLLISSEVSKFSYQSLFVISFASIYTLLPSLLLFLYVSFRVGQDLPCEGITRSIQGQYSHSLFYYQTLQNRFPLLTNRRTYIYDILFKPLKFVSHLKPNNEFLISNMALRFLFLMPSLLAFFFMNYSPFNGDQLTSYLALLIVLSILAFLFTSLPSFIFLGEPDRYLCNIGLPAIYILLVNHLSIASQMLFINLLISTLIVYRLFKYAPDSLAASAKSHPDHMYNRERLHISNNLKFIGANNLLVTMQLIDYFIDNKSEFQKIICMPYNVDTKIARVFWAKHLTCYPIVDILDINSH